MKTQSLNVAKPAPSQFLIRFLGRAAASRPFAKNVLLVPDSGYPRDLRGEQKSFSAAPGQCARLKSGWSSPFAKPSGGRLLGSVVAVWLLILAVLPAQAHWPNTNATKFVQLPDITTNGMDIYLKEYPTILADDFICTNTGPITDIHLWLSSLQDAPAPSAYFELSIWSDVPANPTNGTLSHPGVRLWAEVFSPGQYDIVTAATNLQETFWDLDPPLFMGPDRTLFQYNFYPKEPYTQTGDITNRMIYWLGVSMMNNDPFQGWKTSTNHWGPDFAVLGHYSGGANVTDWKTLFDPRAANGPGLDFSFALTTRQPTNPPPDCCPETNGVKYVQRPRVFGGYDVNASQNLVLADDFRCTNTGPITDIHIWGSWLNNNVDPTAIFELGIWDDVPAQTNGPTIIPSHPGVRLWTQTFGPGQYSHCFYTNTTELFYDASVPAIMGPDNAIYYLCFYPTNPVVQQGTTTAPKIYWLSVNARTTAGSGRFFGWHNSFDYFNDIAVWGNTPMPAAWTPMYDPQGVPLSMAFKITTATNDCPPPVVICPTNKTVECGTSWNFNLPTATSDCCSNVNITVVSTFTNGFCPQLITRTWLITDCLGYSNTCSQTVTVADTTRPVIICPTNKTVECGTHWTFDLPIAYDTCCSNVTVFIYDTKTNGTCPQFITRTWQAVDCCGNTNACSQIVTVVDTTPPSLFCFNDKNVECGTNWVFDPPIAFDNCCSNVTVFILGTVTNGFCPQNITRTWVAMDCCNNTNTCSQTVRVWDTTPPVIICSSNKVVECGTNWMFEPPIAYDTCCSNVTVFVLDTKTNGFCPQDITRTWSAVDCCGNSNRCSQTVRVIDTTPPVIICSSNKTVECGTTWTFDPPIAYDTCCSNVTVFIFGTVTNGFCPQLVTRTWTAMDCCGNTNSCSQTVTVADTKPPIINCPTNMIVGTCGTNAVVTWPVSAWDACCTNVTVVSTPPSGTTFARGTTNLIHIEATDCCGNTNTCDFVVIVTRPKLTLTYSHLAGTITLTWPDGILQEATSILGPWTDVPLATSPYTTLASAPQKFYRLRCP